MGRWLTDDEAADYLDALVEEYDRFKDMTKRKQDQKAILHMEILEANRKGVSLASIARRLGVSRPYVYAMCQEAAKAERHQTHPSTQDSYNQVNQQVEKG